MVHNIYHPVNLTRTQVGYVPLKDRFKSFDANRQITSDQELYFLNQISGYKEHADIGLLFPIPKFVRNEVFNRRKKTVLLTSRERITGAGLVRITGGGDVRVSRV